MTNGQCAEGHLESIRKLLMMMCCEGAISMGEGCQRCQISSLRTTGSIDGSWQYSRQSWLTYERKPK
jgi:hypothetical protein